MSKLDEQIPDSLILFIAWVTKPRDRYISVQNKFPFPIWTLRQKPDGNFNVKASGARGALVPFR